ncbi:MAG: hypothetical protein P8178_05295 [Candidatus Thiodiazotropha sp.]
MSEANTSTQNARPIMAGIENVFRRMKFNACASRILSVEQREHSKRSYSKFTIHYSS